MIMIVNGMGAYSLLRSHVDNDNRILPVLSYSFDEIKLFLLTKTLSNR